MSDELTELPDDWIWTDIKSIASVITGKTPSTSNSAFWDGEIPFVTPSQIDPSGRMLPPNRTLTELGAAQARIVPENSTLAVCIGTVGKIGLLDCPSVINQQLNALVPSQTVSAHFLYYWSQYFLRSWIIENASATVNAAILNKSRLETAPVVLPPLNEQKRIIAQIEALRDRSHKAKAALDAIPELCDRFRQSVLASAFRGDLTADWREQNPDVEPAKDLIERIAEQVMHGKETGRAATINIIPGRAALSVGDPETTVPPNWYRVPLLKIARLESGHTPSRKHPEYWDGDIPWIGIADARQHHGKYIFDTYQHTNKDGLANSAARLLPKNTVCLSRTASVGYVVIMRQPMATSQDFVNWICSDALLPEFLMYALLAESEHLLKFGKGTTHTTIYFPEVKSFHITLPPLQEQKAVVQKVSLFLEAVSKIEQQYQIAQEHYDRIDQSILAKAFRGELVDQDPNDEPASVLLDRIRAEREKIESKGKKGSRKGTGRQNSTPQGQIDLPLE